MVHVSVAHARRAYKCARILRAAGVDGPAQRLADLADVERRPVLVVGRCVARHALGGHPRGVAAGRLRTKAFSHRGDETAQQVALRRRRRAIRLQVLRRQAREAAQDLPERTELGPSRGLLVVVLVELSRVIAHHRRDAVGRHLLARDLAPARRASSGDGCQRRPE